MGIRLTVNKLLEVLQENEGFRKTTSYDSRNLSFTRHNEIKDGKLFYTESGKGMMSRPQTVSQYT